MYCLEITLAELTGWKLWCLSAEKDYAKPVATICLVVVVVAAVIETGVVAPAENAGRKRAQSWEDMQQVGASHSDWLKKVVEM